MLVYYEHANDIYSAMQREKSLKKWKIELIETINPDWHDLYEELVWFLDSRFRGNDKQSGNDKQGGNDTSDLSPLIVKFVPACACPHLSAVQAAQAGADRQKWQKNFIMADKFLLNLNSNIEFRISSLSGLGYDRSDLPTLSSEGPKII